MAFLGFFRRGGRPAWILIAAVLMLLGLSTLLLARTAEVRYERDVTRMVFNDNVSLLEEIRHKVGAEQDSLEALLAASPEAPEGSPFIVVSIAENKLWYKRGDSILFETRVATGSGKSLVRDGGGSHWKFDTPRGRLVVQTKEMAPVWVPPDWHYVEQARKRGLGIVRLNRGQSIPAANGVVTVAGNDVVTRLKNGRTVPFSSREDRDIIVGGNIVIPPFGTNQRKLAGVLGTHRLNLGDGYALHGTNKPETIGRSVSHGCIRLRNADIAKLYEMVPVGTVVYIY